MDKINFFTFKWGNKYGPEYVNRLFKGIQANLARPFTFTCITDDSSGIDDAIAIIDYNTFDPFDYPKDRIFTREKLVLFDRFQSGRNIWVDLDVLVHGDITEVVSQKIEKPTFIWNHWNPLSRSYDWYGKGASCHVNSSFVMWDGDMGQEIWQHLLKYEKEAFFTYKSLDKYLFYQCHRKGLTSYWEEGIVSNYNREAFQKKGLMSIFNTSHISRNKGITEVAYELHEAPGWVNEIWTSYS